MYFSAALLALVATASAIDIRAWKGSGCNGSSQACVDLDPNLDSNGNIDLCMTYSSRGDRTGSKYWFVSRKRADDESCLAEQTDGEKCEAFVESNVIGLADGTMYSIAELTDEKVEELEKIANSGAGADAVPAEFQIFSH
ncbi:hypothetical protein FLONG3_9554 [Fusarium longipes]|uniref:Small secreted n=1 Tax=Fusarium longipes TaxID=694270 RepID=A0A395RWL6_9HYPO|nr:hypothetical protein FLONG3_9554 [Fusarium longipes]